MDWLVNGRAPRLASVRQCAEMMSPSQAMEQKTVPLCVDLDGTVIRTDLLWESMVQLIRRNPLYLFAVLAWWMRGRAYLKAQIGRRVTVDMTALPCHEPFMEYLRSEKKNGRYLILVTASDAGLAEAFGSSSPSPFLASGCLMSPPVSRYLFSGLGETPEKQAQKPGNSP